MRASLLRPVLALSATALAAAWEGGFVPWPAGSPPAYEAVTSQLRAADDLYSLDRFEEFLEALERGEDSSHVRVFQSDIDAGLHDLESLFRAGDALFTHEFRNEDGLSDHADARLQRVHVGERGGLDSFSCAGCHSQGGPDGAGSPSQNAYTLGDG
jgi:hypothetical protein